MRATDTTSAEGDGRPGFCAAVGLVALLVVAAGLSVVAAAPAPAASSEGSGSKALSRLEIEAPNAEILKRGSIALVAAKDGQALKQGDALRTRR